MQAHGAVGLRMRREAADLGREALGAKSGGTASVTIWRIERGEVRPHRSTLAALANVFGCTAEQLYAEPTPMEIRRLQAGLTRPQLAQGASVPEGLVIRIEAGEEVPDRTTAEQLASTLQTSVDMLFPPRGERRSNA